MNIDCIYNLFKFSNVEIEQYECYQKMSFRNRCMVAGANGLIQLSVPLQNGRAQKCPVRDVRIDYAGNWQKQHWRTLFSCYGNAPFFEFYRDWLEAFYQKEFVFLFDMNMEALSWLKKVIKIPGEISLTNSFIKDYTAEGISDCRNRWLPKNYLLNPSPVRYRQVFEYETGFMPSLSVLDMLFCTGPQSNLLLQATGC